MDLKFYLDERRGKEERLGVRLKVLGYGVLAGLVIVGMVFYISHRDRQIVEYYSQCASYQEAINKLNLKLSNISNLTFQEREEVIAKFNELMQLYTSNCDVKYILGD